MMFFGSGKGAHLSDNEKRALKAVGKLEDPGMLFEAVMGSAHEPVQLAALAKLRDEGLISQVAKEVPVPSVRLAAVGYIRDPKELAWIAENDPAGDVRAEAVKRVEDQQLLVKIAMADTADWPMSPVAGEAAVERIDSEVNLYDIALRGKDFSVRMRAAEKLSRPDLLTRLAIQTQEVSIFENAVEKISDPEESQKIIDKARIEDKSVLLKLASPESLIQKCFDESDESLVETVYETTWDIGELRRLRVICKASDVIEKIDLRIKTAENMASLQKQGMPAELNKKATEYIKSLESDIYRYSLAKKTVKEQGRQLSFDAIYNQSDLQQAVLNSAGISLQYFHGGLLGGLLFINTGVNLAENAREAVWAVIARLQLADSKQVKSRIKPNMSHQEAERLIYDILKLWYDKMV